MVRMRQQKMMKRRQLLHQNEEDILDEETTVEMVLLQDLILTDNEKNVTLVQEMVKQDITVLQTVKQKQLLVRVVTMS